MELVSASAAPLVIFLSWYPNLSFFLCFRHFLQKTDSFTPIPTEVSASAVLLYR
jgi:hypothetical protein